MMFSIGLGFWNVMLRSHSSAMIEGRKARDEDKIKEDHSKGMVSNQGLDNEDLRFIRGQN